MVRALSAAFVMFVVASVADAQFTITPGGVQNTAGGIGDPGNSNFTSTYTGPNAIFGNFNVTGTLTSVVSGTWPLDSGFSFVNTTSGGGAIVFGSTQDGSFTTVNINRTYGGGLFWFNQNDQLAIETFEVFDDGPGADAQWTNLTLTFNNSVSATLLGSFNQGTSFVFDTVGSDFDTQIAVFTSNGTLVDSDDDTFGLQSQVNLGQLAAGDYYLVVGGFESFFGNGFAFAGADFGNYTLNLNGSTVSSGGTIADQFATFSFSVFSPVPEPSTVALVALVGGIGLLVRGRRRTAL